MPAMASPLPTSTQSTPVPTRPSSTQPISTSTSTSTPAVSIAPTAHLDPACYVKGTHPVTISSGTIIHPRCRLITDRGPITIARNCLLSERCVLGIDKDLNPLITSPDTNDTTPESTNTPSNGITIGASTTLHTTVKLQPPTTIGEACVLEAGVVLAPGCTVGAHSKICAGIKLPSGTLVPEWTVVYGMNGQMRRRRRRGEGEEVSGDEASGAFLVEETRLEGLGRERAGVEALLRMNATKGLGSAGGGSGRKRESVLVKGGG